MENPLLNRIELNQNVMLGKPVIKGTRITVGIILKKLYSGQVLNFQWMRIREVLNFLRI